MSVLAKLWICDSAGEIGTVDGITGMVTLVGNAGTVLTDIAFNPQGQLFGVDFNALYSINTQTGAATLIGNLNVGSAEMNSLVFDSSGTLYASSTQTKQLYTINTQTGQAT